jgi:predicted metal-dependent phosphoesterase TrpH
MVYADLHVHTDRSDGQLSLSSVPAAARRADVSVVAVTDHDRVHPGFEAPVQRHAADADADGGAASVEPVTLVRGVELRVESAAGRVDLLGYGVEPTSDLRDLEARIQADRRERGRAIVDRVEDRLGVDLDVEVHEGFGRPHVARAVDTHPDTEYDYGGAFEHLIGSGDPCYVARDVPDFETGRRVLAAACGLVGLAHPLRYDDPEAALALTADLDAVELPYPYGGDVDRGAVERAVREHDLVVTGGSDAHDDRLGRAGLAASEFERVRERLPSPVAV